MRLRDLRRKILAEHGVEIAKPKYRRSIARRKPPTSRVPNRLKTEKMRLLELQHGKRIELILTDGTNSNISRVYGLPRQTVIRWRKALSLEYQSQ